MTTAKEMFKKLGYELKVTSYDVIVYVNESQREGWQEHSQDVIFLKQDKLYIAQMLLKSSGIGWRMYMNAELHQAITQQMRELGWIE